MDLVRTLRLGWGLCLIAKPQLPLAAAHVRADKETRVAARLLGARHFLIGLTVNRGASRRRRALAVSTDAAHAASMAVLALLDPHRRRVAIVESVIASGFAAITTRAAAARPPSKRAPNAPRRSVRGEPARSPSSRGR